MNTLKFRIRSAARALLLLIILGQSSEGLSQIVFETREEVLPTEPATFRYNRTSPADVDGDGDLDLIITGLKTLPNGSQFFISEIHINNGDANFSLVPDNFIGAEHSVVADVDGDLDMDVIIYGAGVELYNCKLYLNDGNGNFTPVFEDQFPPMRGSIEFFYYDEDELPDVLISGRTGSQRFASIYRNLDNGRFEKISSVEITPQIGASSSSVEVGDIDNDGDQDIIVFGELTNTNYGTYIFQNNSGIFTVQHKINFLKEGDMKLRDFNGDGFLDLLILGRDNINNHAAEYYLNDGQGNFQKASNQNFLPADFPSLETADFDGDGDLDVFIEGREFNPGNNGNVLYLNDGTGNFEVSNEFVYMGTGGTAVGNFDGKGQDDILVFGILESLQGPHKWVSYLNQTVLNKPPVVTEVSISGELLAGKQLLGSYVFQDPEGAEDESSLSWYRAIDILGTEKMEIVGANFSTYTSGDLDINKYISFEVVPFDGTETGQVVQSQWVGPILLPVPNIVVKGNNSVLPEEAPPSLENHTHFGKATRNNEIQRSFTIENNGTGDLVVNNIMVSGDNAADFTVMDEDVFTIVPGDSKAFNIKFSPLGLGERTAEIRIESNDKEKESFNLRVSGEGLNSAPVFNSPSVVDHIENHSVIVVDVNASNGEGGADDLEVIYSISGGEDEALFTIDQVTGQLSFFSSRDFEDPQDLDNDNTYKVDITVNDEQLENNVATQHITVTVINLDEAPTANCIGDLTVFLDGNGSASITADDINSNSIDDMSIVEYTITPSQFSCSDVGPKEVVLMVKDSGGNISSCTTSINVVDNQKPEISGIAPLSKRSEPGGCGAYLTIVPPAINDNCDGTVITGVRKDGLGLEEKFPVGDTEITWTAIDVNNVSSDPFTQLITVTNDVPGNITFTSPDGPREIGTPIPMRGSFSDDNIESVTWKAYNGNQVVHEFSTEATGTESSYTFQNLPAGVYTIILELRDHCGMSATGYSDYVVLYDPNGGFVTGGGWFDSPLGALRGSEAVGRAHFGFNAKYKNGNNDAGEVGGNTSFQFKTGDLDFKSYSHEKMSLVVSGGFKATYKGSGSVNGKGEYQFMVTVIDAEETSNHTIDLFRIKIWNSDGILYDNMMDAVENADPSTAIGGGSIVIHKPKTSNPLKAIEGRDGKELTEGLEVFTAIPNPMEESTYIKFKLNKSTGVRLNLYDLNGREITRLFEGEVQQGKEYEIEVKDLNLMKGVYIYRLVLDSGEAYQKQLLVN